MQPLIITATPNISWLHPEVAYPRTAEAIVEEARLCYENGAAILHLHGEGGWAETILAVRKEIPILIQGGMSSRSIPERMDVFRCKADMISIILNHHDEAFALTQVSVLHTRTELAEYARLDQEFGLLPEFEVWHAGSVWNLNYLIGQGLVKPPYFCTLFFGWPGGTWSPPTVEEYLYRRKLLPPKCLINVSIMSEGQRDILAAAIRMGDHVRVGTEDYPYNHAGEVAATHELVRETAKIARAIGRPLATIEQARQMVGLGGERSENR